MNTQTTTYQSYDSYKDSGADWVGRIPSDWSLKPLKYLFAIQDTRLKHHPSVDMLLSVSGYDGIVPKNLDGFEGQMPSEDVSEYRIVRKKNLVVNTMWLNYTGLGVSEYEGYVSPAYRAYEIGSEIYPRFAHYLLRSPLYVQKYSSLLYGVRPNSLQVKPYDFDRIEVLIPTLEEQKTISNFLDTKLSLLDSTIRRKKLLIELLQEKRQALITQAVTKGLDPKAKMKDSGVEWIGEIPEGWEVRKVNDLFTISRGRVIPKTELDEVGKYPVYSSQTLNDGLLGMINTYDFEKDILTWTTDGALAGTVFKRTGKYSCTNICGMMIPRPGAAINLDYMLYAVQHSAHENKRPDTNGFKIMSGEMKKIYITKPPIETQNMIAHKLNRVINKITLVTKKLENQISKLNEYKSALIYNAVTGKIKV